MVTDAGASAPDVSTRNDGTTDHEQQTPANGDLTRAQRRAKPPRQPTRDERAANAALETAKDEAKAPNKPFNLELNNGIVLRVKPVSPLLVGAVAQKIERPKVPLVVVNPDEPNRLEENPEDPDYLKALAESDEAEAEAVNQIALLLGLEILTVPEGMHPHTSDEWIGDLEWLNALPEQFDRTDERARRLAWLKYYAFQTHEDVAGGMRAPLLLSGVTEEEIRQVVGAFRRVQERRAAGGLRSAVETGDGDRDSEDGAAGSDVRGTGSGDIQRLPVEGMDGTPASGAGDGDRAPTDADDD